MRSIFGAPVRVFFVAVVLGVGSQFSPAQEKVVSDSSPLSVVQTAPAKVAGFEKELTEATRAAIDQEVAAERLNNSVSQLLRQNLRPSMSTLSGSEIKGMLAAAQGVSKNEAVSKACKELEVTWTNIQSQSKVEAE